MPGYRSTSTGDRPIAHFTSAQPAMPSFRKPLSASIASLLLLLPMQGQDEPSTAPGGATSRLAEVVITADPLGRSAFDQAQPVSTLSGLPLKLKLAPSLGETLSGEPGITTSGYTTGASRPIIRGLADNRVLVLQNGTDIFDVSNLSPDHAPSVEPLAAQHIDVVRGPATILYGSSAIAGVINVIDNRIPTQVPARTVSGEIDGRFASATLERSGYAAFDIRATDHVVFHLDGTLLRADNLHIPGHALSPRVREGLSPEQRERGNRFGGDPKHIVPNTAVRTQDFGIGVSYIGERGYLGFSFSQFLSEYGVPNNPAVSDPVEEPERVKLNVKKRQYNVRSALNDPLPGFALANVKATYTEYGHNELDDNIVGSTFRTRGVDSRLELVQKPLGLLEGSVGLQYIYRTIGVYGEEAFLRPNQTNAGAVFAFEEIKLAPVRFQIGARVEYQRIHIGSDDPEKTALMPGDERTKEFVPISAAAGVVWDFAKEANAALTVRYSERAPTPEELFARGPHDATFQFLVGQPGLPEEKVLGVDLTVRKKAGFVTGSLSAFYNHFFDFIDFSNTGVVEDGLDVFNYADKRADFFGGEGQIAFHFLPQEVTRLAPVRDGKSVKELVTKEAPESTHNPQDLYLELNADYVHAQDATEHRPLARIPPLRYGAAIGYQGPSLGARVELLRVNHQDRTAEFETGTEGYTMLNASLNYTFMRGSVTYDLYLKGTNLTDETAREHTSFLKDVIPLPGRSVTVGLRASF
jgi:iron complex outermembrane receptor protein